ncbi:MAG: single-stranded DNA-binding protein [Patescibacteria group bacterium]
MNLNKVFLLGRLTADPQLRVTPTGHQVGTFSIATNRIWNDKVSGKREEVEYHNIVVWGRQAEIAQKFLSRGGLVLVEGRIQTRSWDDKQGQKRKTTEVVAERIQLGPRSAASSAGSQRFQEVKPQINEIPVINLDEGQDFSIMTGNQEMGADTDKEIKPEDLPF